MNIPMSVQADALQVMVPAATTDYVSVLANAVAILFGTLVGVLVGAWLSRRERKQLDHVKELEEIVHGIRYVQSFLSIYQDIAGKAIINLSETGELYLSESQLKMIPKAVVPDMDYRNFASIVVHFPSLILDASAAHSSVSLLVGLISEFNELVAKERKNGFSQRKDELDSELFTLLNRFVDAYDFIYSTQKTLIIDGITLLLDKCGLDRDETLPSEYQLLMISNEGGIPRAKVRAKNILFELSLSAVAKQEAPN